MIIFKNLDKAKPYQALKSYYDEAFKANQNKIEAIAISSYSTSSCEVTSRFVNLKYLDNKKFIFFTNYESQKSICFSEHNQISALIYWDMIDVQIRMKSYIKKTSLEFNQHHFENRLQKKNALALSSNQSKKINSYKDVHKNYQKALDEDNLTKCPIYWGGYSFEPYYFEFWTGHESRINKRVVYEYIDNDEWTSYFLQP